jgi:hypothetical protein
MIADLLKDVILKNIGPLKPASKNWHKRNCPLCHTQGHGHDKRNRFGIQFSFSSILVHCFNCSFSANYTEGKALSNNFKFFLTQLNIDKRFISQIEFEVFKQINSIEVVREGEVVTEYVEKERILLAMTDRWVRAKLPPDSLPITDWLNNGLTDPNFLDVVEYALSRKITNLDKFYWSPDTNMYVNKRLIIPYYYRHKIVGFSCRLSYNSPKKEIPKYYQQCPEDFVYNLDNQEGWHKKYVIVTEGVLDAWAVNGVAILGECNQTKIDIINRLQKEVIVCPDRDKKGTDLVNIAMDNDWAVALPKWSDDIKDAADASLKYGRLLTTHSIIDSMVTSKNKISVAWGIAQHEREKRMNNGK